MFPLLNFSIKKICFFLALKQICSTDLIKLGISRPKEAQVSFEMHQPYKTTSKTKHGKNNLNC